MWIGAIGGQKEKTIKRNRDKNVCHFVGKKERT